MSLLLSLAHLAVTIILLAALIRRVLVEQKARHELHELQVSYDAQRFRAARLEDDLNHALGIR